MFKAESGKWPAPRRRHAAHSVDNFAKGGKQSKVCYLRKNNLALSFFICFLESFIYQEYTYITKLIILSAWYKKYNFVLAYFDHKKVQRA